jgi:hypothetical protein
MPLWNIYHPVGTYDADTKQAMSETIVKLYPMLPPFYVGVLFHEKPADTFFISGKPTDDFVRIAVDHIARQFPNQEIAQNWLNQMSKMLTPFIEGCGLHCISPLKSPRSISNWRHSILSAELSIQLFGGSPKLVRRL